MSENAAGGNAPELRLSVAKRGNPR